MTKKDIIALADALRGVEVPESVLARLCAFCGADNPKFDERRWRDYLRGDCGPNGGKIKSKKASAPIC